MTIFLYFLYFSEKNNAKFNFCIDTFSCAAVLRPCCNLPHMLNLSAVLRTAVMTSHLAYLLSCAFGEI